jgi:low temperature requirement protein LtrA
VDQALRSNFARVLCWLPLSGAIWIVGGAATGPLRLALWGAALGLDYLGPAVRFWTPGLGASVSVVLFESTLRGWLQLSHLAGIASMSVLLAVGAALPPLALGALVSGILVAVAVWESLSLSARAAS